MEMRELLNEMNRNAFNNFKMKSGLNYGHVVAGVIGIATLHIVYSFIRFLGRNG